jgi:hypothetical protein
LIHKPADNSSRRIPSAGLRYRAQGSYYCWPGARRLSAPGGLAARVRQHVLTSALSGSERLAGAKRVCSATRTRPETVLRRRHAVQAVLHRMGSHDARHHVVSIAGQTMRSREEYPSHP